MGYIFLSIFLLSVSYHELVSVEEIFVYWLFLRGTEKIRLKIKMLLG